MKQRGLLAAWGSIILLFLSLPIGVLLVRALTSPSSVTPNALTQALTLSLLSTLSALALTLFFGTPLAYILARWHLPLQRVISTLVELPVILPPAVAGLALLLTFGRRGFFGGLLTTLDLNIAFTFSAVILAQVFVAAPFYIRAAQSGFRQVPPEIEEAGRVDGAEGWALYWHITFPLARSAIASGTVLAWARALGEFGATLLFAGSLPGRTQTMPLLIYNLFERDTNAALQTGALLVGLAFAALVLARWLSQTTEE